jgi:hypothetical protein
VIPLNDDRRRILDLLANTGPLGVTEAALIANEIAAKMMAEFLRVGWVTVAAQRVQADGKVIDMRRYSITEAGRRAIDRPL